MNKNTSLKKVLVCLYSTIFNAITNKTPNLLYNGFKPDLEFYIKTCFFPTKNISM